MLRRTVLIGALLVATTALVTSIFWFAFSSANIMVPKYLVQVRYKGTINFVSRISIVFLQGNRTVASCILRGDGTWHNVTLPAGIYIVKTYNADSGHYLNKHEINVAKDIAFEVSP